MKQTGPRTAAINSIAEKLASATKMMNRFDSQRLTGPTFRKWKPQFGANFRLSFAIGDVLWSEEGIAFHEGQPELVRASVVVVSSGVRVTIF
jgi:hypothetical protein